MYSFSFYPLVSSDQSEKYALEKLAAVCSLPFSSCFVLYSSLCSLCCYKVLHTWTDEGRWGKEVERTQLAFLVPTVHHTMPSMVGVSPFQWVALSRIGIWKWLYLHYLDLLLSLSSGSLECSPACLTIPCYYKLL